jgi:four helix bundle protein
MPGNNETHEQNFEQLECWKACRELRLFISRMVVPLLPIEEKFRLIDQLIRSARSSTANIAEGDGRYNYLDNSKFCRNARGSCKEVLDHLITANDENIISKEILLEGRIVVEKAVRLLSAYIRYLNKAKRGNGE